MYVCIYILKKKKENGEVKNVIVGRNSFRENYYYNYIIFFYSRYWFILKFFLFLIILFVKGEK